MSKHEFEKVYYECLARNILEKALPERYHDIELKDKPDLVNYDGRGIEVTRAMYKDAGEAARMFQLVKNESVLNGNKRALVRLNQLKYRIIRSPNNTIIGYGPQEAIWVTTEELKNSYKSKMEKIENYGKDTDLFIYSPMFNLYDQQDIEEFQNWMIMVSKEYERSFKYVYVFQFWILFICDNSNSQVSIIDMERALTEGICESALKYAKADL